MMINDNAIALVGAACRFPGADNLAQFWSNLRAGRDTLHRFSRNELLAAGEPQDLIDHPDYVPVRGVLDGGERFDWPFFGYSPAEAGNIDPQQRVFLQCASIALDHAAIDPQRFPGWIGVYAGCDAVTLGSNADVDDTQLTTRIVGWEKDFLASRVAYKLGLRGPAVTVQSACSTSLVAVHVACQSLLSYECDVALAGGACLWLPQAAGYLFQDGHILSRSGRCQPFDEASDGTVSSAGVGLVVLKRLSDALESNDEILAIVRGSAINNDGGEKVGYSAPSVPGQRDVIQLALARADVAPVDIGYVEAHGTGTRVGDAVEIAALTAAFGDVGSQPSYCRLGAVKSNIGHTGAAAGIAGLIKTALMMRHREFVPTVHFLRPNPVLALQDTPFLVSTRTERWKGDGSLFAGVSSFGFGGTNAHAVLESPPLATDRRAGNRPTTFILSAKTPQALRQMSDELADQIAADESLTLDDVAWTLASGRRRFSYRTSIQVRDRAHAVNILRDPVQPIEVTGEPSVAFLFPGQGTLRPGSTSSAHDLLPVFQETFDEISALVRDRCDIDLSLIRSKGTDPSWFRRTEHQQLGLFAVGYGLGRQMQAWGVEPMGMLGHSLGEYVAAAFAGVWGLEDALAIVHERSRAMRAAPPGGMLALAMTAEEAAEILSDDDALSLAIIEPGRVVISGDLSRINTVQAHLIDQGVDARLLQVERAFHSPLMRPAAEALHRIVASTPVRAPQIPFVSNLTGDLVSTDLAASPAYWVDHMLGTVRLDKGIKTLLGNDCDVLVELGSGTSMSSAVLRYTRGEKTVVPMLGRSSEHERENVLRALGQLWQHGVSVDFDELCEVPDARRRALPGHPFEPLNLLHRRQRSKAEPSGYYSAELPVSLTTPRWIQTEIDRTVLPDSVLIIDHSNSPLPRLILGDRADRPERLPFDAELVRATVKRYARDAVDPTLMAVIPETVNHGLLCTLDAISDMGIRLLVTAGGTADVLGGETVSSRGELLAAWTEHHRNSGRSWVSLLDFSEAQPPESLPVVTSASHHYAWRGHRWWCRTQQPVDWSDGSATRFAVLAPGRTDGTRLATDLSERGLAVTAFANGTSATDVLAEPSQVVSELAWASKEPQISKNSALNERLKLYCAGIAGRFVLRQTGLTVNETVPVQAVHHRIDPSNRLPRLVGFLLKAMVEEGWLRSDDGYVELVAGAEQEIDDACDIDLSDDLDGLVRLLQHVLEAYPQIFTGTIAPLSVLFPDADSGFIDSLLGGNRMVLDDADAALNAMEDAIRALCRTHPDRMIRILEVGAGGGGLTWRLLENWTDRAHVEYHFTDISPLIVRRAKARAEDKGLANMRFSTLDLTKDPLEQGLAANTYDLVLAYNSIHVSPSIPATLRQLSRLLTPGGSLGLVEVTRPQRWAHLVWGLAPGWWDFDDDLRTDSVHLPSHAWPIALEQAGLTRTAPVPASLDSDHIVVFASPEPAEPPCDPVERLAHPLCGQDFDALVYFPALDTPGSDTWWRDLPTRLARGDGAKAWVISEDTATASAQLCRRSLDPTEADPRWIHLEVPSFDNATMTALAEILRRSDLPGVLRLTQAPTTLVSPTAMRPEIEQPSPTSIPVPVPPDGEGSIRDAAAEVWCEVLGVATAHEADDFFRAGGDSLMLVQLRAKLRDRLGVQIPMSAIVDELSFSQLVNLLHDGKPGSATGGNAAKSQRPSVRPQNGSQLVTFREHGEGTPLFLAAPAAGSSLCYRHLIPLLESNRPYYGIESPGLDTGRPLDRLEYIAAHHIEAIRHAQPNGPYLLGGWSFGAMVSHEIVRQLSQQGEPVDLILGLDGFLPNTRGLPVWTRPSLSLRSRWFQIQARYAVGGSVRSRYRLDDNDHVARIATVAKELKLGANVVPDYVGVHNANITAMLRYRPRPVPCNMVVFKAGADAALCARLQKHLQHMYRSVVVHTVPGTHWTLLDRGNVDRLAAGVRAALRNTEQAPDFVHRDSAERK